MDMLKKEVTIQKGYQCSYSDVIDIQTSQRSLYIVFEYFKESLAKHLTANSLTEFEVLGVF